MMTLLTNASPRTTRRSLPLAVRETGEGEPLILLHGLGLTGDAFRFVAPWLAETSRLIVPDLRGHGGNAHLPGPCTTEAMAADVVSVLDALGIPSAHILGYSHGGAVAQVLAHRHPQRTRSLMLVSSYAVQRVTWWQHLLGQTSPAVVTRLGTRPFAWMVHHSRSAGGGRRLSPQAAALAANMLAENDRHCLGDALRQSGQFDSRAWLDTLQMPTLVIAGDADRVIVPQQAEDLAMRIPGAQLHMFPGAGHALPLSHPTELSALITAWLVKAGVEIGPGCARAQLVRELPRAR